MDDCLCGCICGEPVEPCGDDVDRIVVVRSPRNLTSPEFAAVRSTVKGQLRDDGRDYPVIVLEPGFDIEIVLV